MAVETSQPIGRVTIRLARKTGFSSLGCSKETHRNTPPITKSSTTFEASEYHRKTANAVATRLAIRPNCRSVETEGRNICRVIIGWDVVERAMLFGQIQMTAYFESQCAEEGVLVSSGNATFRL